MAAPVVPIFIGGLYVWGVYRRIRRNIGRQQLRPVRISISIAIFLLISALFFGLAGRESSLLLSQGGGLLLGAALGFLGLRLTKFETNEQGAFYTPNTHIGVVLSALFIGRMAYRYWVLNHSANAANHAPAFQSPLTFFIFGLTAGYYLVYYIGLFVHRSKNRQP
ncbi:MAG TPA: DUF1453 domain-containing protein [Verrucomicrobiae bacterium]|jgi:hypothetical protein